MLTQAELDILVFADQMSELGAYLYSMGRFAAVQVSTASSESGTRVRLARGLGVVRANIWFYYGGAKLTAVAPSGCLLGQSHHSRARRQC